MRNLHLLLAVTGLAFSVLAQAQPYPAKPVKIITSFLPGSSIDVTARTIAQKLSDTWRQTVTVENRPGGGGTGSVGADFVAKSPADGYTWLLAPNSVMIIGPHLVKAPFDVFKDFTPVGQVAIIPFFLVVIPSVPAKTVAELVAYAKANPRKLNYASMGNGSPHHLGSELIKRSSGIDMVHVPYKGASQAITDLLGNRVQVFVGAASSLLPYIRDGKLKLLASAGDKRLPAFPDVPTVAETLPGVVVDAWLGVFMPTGVAKEIISKVNADISSALNTPEMKASLTGQGIEVATSSPEALATTMRNDYARWGRLIQEAGIKAD